MKHTPTPWRYIEFADSSDCFVQADRSKPDHPYDIEILGDDTNSKFYPLEQKKADAKRIVECVNLFHEIEDPTAYMKNLNAMLLKAGDAVNENEALKKQIEMMRGQNELAAASNAEATQNTMHHAEPPQVSSEAIIRDIYKDIHIIKKDVEAAISKVHYDLIMRISQEHISEQGREEMYYEYTRYASRNEEYWNPIMRKNPDGTLSMFTHDEFKREVYWVWPMLQVLVRNGREMELDMNLNRIGKNIEYFHTKFSLIDSRTERTDNTASTTNGWTIAAVGLIALDVIIRIIEIITK